MVIWPSAMSYLVATCKPDSHWPCDVMYCVCPTTLPSLRGHLLAETCTLSIIVTLKWDPLYYTNNMFRYKLTSSPKPPLTSHDAKRTHFSLEIPPYWDFSLLFLCTQRRSYMLFTASWSQVHWKRLCRGWCHIHTGPHLYHPPTIDF